MLTRIHFLSFPLVFSLASLSASCAHRDWRTASRDSAGIAPLPTEQSQAIVQVYAARAINWRGVFAVHSWIATKEKNADHYVTYHVIGFRLKRTGSTVVIEKDLPDRRWFGAEPFIIHDIRGSKAESAIAKIAAAAKTYPYDKTYRAWPGPNSNTFISHIIRRVPEIGVELPPHAIGKDWLDNGRPFDWTESGTGVQLSLFGLLGLSLGLAEGIELNVIGLNLGIDFWRPALKLPLVGRVGIKDAPVFD